ncbi:hypothetical protein Q5425_32835 [Amycolatopsis sp. A133]|nr:hypothetical protein [Amycolatopsis sp. A133]MDQ7808546.1 hypothetical protein [Amycolatopsis sp. A133]
MTGITGTWHLRVKTPIGTWWQRITEPMRPNLEYDVTVTGERVDA